jgi:hypothetical protein
MKTWPDALGTSTAAGGSVGAGRAGVIWLATCGLSPEGPRLRRYAAEPGIAYRYAF